MQNFNRRDFLKISAVATASASLPHAVSALASDSPSGNVSVWTTAGSQKHAKLPSLEWKKLDKRATNLITVDPAEQYQQVLGFGAAFTDAACYTLSRLEPSVRQELFHNLFHPSAIGLSASRVCMGASDYSRNVYSYSEGSEPDPEMTRFSIAHDREYILPILREARAANPDMWLLASPWSPPGWMKFNNSMLGGSMRRKWLGAYAKYFDKFLAAYVAEGVKINSVTPQNEVDTDQDGKMPACIWAQEYEIEFVRDHLGPALAKSSDSADIWVLDHNYNLWGRAIGELEDPGAKKFIKGVAWHGYVGTPDAMTHVKKHFPDVDMFWTEGGPDFDTPGYETEWAKWSTQFTSILRNWSRSIIAWNYALDEKGKPNIGPFNCAGLVTVHSATRELTYSGQYWAMQHFSQHIQRGAKILKSTGGAEVQHVVARNTRGGYVAVLTNSAKSPATANIAVGNSMVSIELPSDSVTTLEWS
ncbi:MAG TPA: twin-arginine translocation signal domain-containing protein [Terriglobales bacterium]|nr:twin-arginine translocation signal domain-containing protein [Terriglobales bacterium]